jgi:formate/nitrite transporter FocA (FNT family)
MAKSTRTSTKSPADQTPSSAKSEAFQLSRAEQAEVEDKLPSRAAVLHEVVRRAGDEELGRSFAALLWSSIAAGLTMGFSFIARAVLHRHLGDYPERFLLESLGYSFGFIVVIVARQQLFTENTMTAVLPLMTQPSVRKFLSLLRLWSSVLLGNLVGVALFSFGVLHLQQFDAETQKTLLDIGTELMGNTPWQMVTKGILAGWLIATMVWMLANTEYSQLSVIVLITYLIAISGCTHIVVGSAESLYLVFAGKLSLTSYVFDFALPTLAGNVVGGSFIFALISHAQVRNDVT